MVEEIGFRGLWPAPRINRRKVLKEFCDIPMAEILIFIQYEMKNIK